MNQTSGVGLVVNARARSGRRAFEKARAALAARGVALLSAHLVQEPAEVKMMVERALDGGVRRLVIGGGDGTLSSVSGLVAGCGAVMGVIPLGTANDFARTLGIPSGVEQACEVVACGRVARVDLGIAGDRHFLNVASFGLGATVAQKVSASGKKMLGPLAYPLATARALASTPRFSVRIAFPAGGREELGCPDVLQVAVGNGRFYGGGRSISPFASINDESLDVCVITRGPAAEMLKVARRVRSGDYSGLRSVMAFRTPELSVETTPVLPLNVDGELRQTDGPVRFGVRPGALQVLVPPAGPAGPAGRAGRAGQTGPASQDAGGVQG